jgi:SAM-dependent methyltransferase
LAVAVILPVTGCGPDQQPESTPGAEISDAALRKQLLGLRSVGGTSVYNFGIYHAYNPILEKYCAAKEEAVVVEIGPGANLASGVLFALSGIKKYYGTDIYQSPRFYDAEPYAAIAAIIETTHRDFAAVPVDSVFTVENEQVGDGQTLASDRVRFNPDKVEYLYPYLSSEFPMPEGSVDYVFSNACFEHFVTPQETIEHIFMVLKPGGITAHQIDLREHDRSKEPLEFLKVSPEEWRSRFSDSSIHMYTNQLRAPDYRQGFERAGFKILEWQEQNPEGYRVTEEVISSLHPAFQKYTAEELEVLGLFVIAQKPHQ